MAKAPHLQMVGSRTLSPPQRPRIMTYRTGAQAGPDFYETPAVATEALLGAEPFPHVIWEPACGAGAISKVLEAHGHEVISTDLYDYGYGKSGQDFFGHAHPLAQTIITNAPFNRGDEFIDHACTICPKTAFLMRLQWLESQKRRDGIFKKHRLSRVLVFSKRLPMMHQVGWEGPRSTSTIAFAWFVFDRGHAGPPTVGWL
jgi:hypothetical protein